MAFECTSNDGEVNINSITKVHDVEAHKKINRYERMANGYSGPDFSTLDDVNFLNILKGWNLTNKHFLEIASQHDGIFERIWS